MTDFAAQLAAIEADAQNFAAEQLAIVRAALAEADQALDRLRASGIAVRELSRMSAEPLSATRFELSIYRRLA